MDEEIARRKNKACGCGTASLAEAVKTLSRYEVPGAGMCMVYARCALANLPRVHPSCLKKKGRSGCALLAGS